MADSQPYVVHQMMNLMVARAMRCLRLIAWTDSSYRLHVSVASQTAMLGIGSNLTLAAGWAYVRDYAI
eukprot:scaffold647836_cov38-Prasinocladus_malaysianus.AAC.2